MYLVSRRFNKGFTLIELIIVLSIVGLLLAACSMTLYGLSVYYYKMPNESKDKIPGMHMSIFFFCLAFFNLILLAKQKLPFLYR